MKRILLGLLALVALFFGVRALVHALAGDETKIRWLLEDMTEGFGETRMNPILSGLAQDFLDEGTGANKDQVRAGLAALFLQRKDAQTKRFPYRAAIAEETLRIALEPQTALAEFELVLEESQGEQWHVAWRASVRAELAGEHGWRIRRTRVDTLEGRRPR